MERQKERTNLIFCKFSVVHILVIEISKRQ